MHCELIQQNRIIGERWAYGSFEKKCPISEKATLARRASKGLRFAEFPLCRPLWRVGLVCDIFFRTSHKPADKLRKVMPAGLRPPLACVYELQ